VALFLTVLLGAYISRSTFIFFWVAVLYAAWSSGFTLALLLALLSVLAVDWLFVPPVHTFDLPDAPELLMFGIFVLVSGTVSRLTSTAVRAQRRTEEQTRELADLAVRLEEQAVEMEQQTEEAQSLAEELADANERLLATSMTAEQERHAAESARASAEEANRAKSEFLTMMSHELRTPLNAIAGYAELLAMGIRGPVTSEQLEDLTRITRAQRHLLSLINDLLNFAKLDAGRVVFKVEEVRLADVLAAVEPLVGPQMQAKHIRYSWERCPPDLTAWADAEKVHQVLVNLLSNAAKFTPAEGEVRVWCSIDEREVTVHVRDTGSGIPRERLQDVFDPFVQVARTSTQPLEGTGLGLAISREIVRALGGRIWVESEMGRGSTFSFTLHRQRQPELAQAGNRFLLGVSPPAAGWPAPTPSPTPIPSLRASLSRRSPS
jgi:signal transduction histidine kinase